MTYMDHVEVIVEKECTQEMVFIKACKGGSLNQKTSTDIGG